MALSSPIGSSDVILAIAIAAAWGLGCAVFERFVMAPRRRLSVVGPAYFPAMIVSLFVGGVYATNEGTSFVFAILMAGVFFLVGAVPAVATFHLGRWTLRTRFADETNG